MRSDSSASRLSIAYRHDGDRPLLALSGEVDDLTAGEFRTAIDRTLDEHSRVELDLREVRFMDSGGLAVLVAAHRRLGQDQEVVVVRHPSPMILRLLEVTGIDQIVDVRRGGSEDRQPI